MKIILLILILLIPVVGAQIDYNNYESLNMHLSLNSEFSLEGLAENSEIDFIESNLTIFPKKSHNTEISSLIINSYPESIISKGEEQIGFRWDNPETYEFQINLESAVKSRNVMHSIDTRVPFPIKPINSKYTQPGPFIDITKEINDQAREIVKYEDDMFHASFKVAEWIEKNIKYDLSTLTAEVVQPSSWVLKNRNGVCDELTNLFISMMRSLGVPARYVTGMAYTNTNGEWGPHAWAEVYFPDVGWVPFDVTYGQFGWVDPTHIKLKTTVDSGDPSIKYIWRGKRVDFTAKEIDIKTGLKNKGNIIENLASLQVKPLFDNAGAGSYVPVEIKIKNNNNHYLPEKLVLTKAPDITEKNVKYTLLEPEAENSVYWIIRIPDKIKPYTNYYTTIEVEDMFHNTAQYNLSYSLGGKTISRLKAESMIAIEEKSEITKDIPSSPFLQIKELKYNKNPGYREKFKISFILDSVEPVNNIKIYVNKKEIVGLDELSNSKRIEFNAEGKNFVGDVFEIKIIYYDKKGTEHIMENELAIIVKDFPWYIVILKILKLM